MTSTTTYEDMILQTDASGAPVRLEYVRGRLKVEASPASRHQMTAKAIEASIKPTGRRGERCVCYTLQDVLIRFPDPDASLKRPDIAIFCAEPPASDEVLDVLPAAIIEIISVGYEDKDLGPDGAVFYLDYVADVLVVDPRKNVVYHYRPHQARAQHIIALTIDLQCGCRVTV